MHFFVPKYYRTKRPDPYRIPALHLPAVLVLLLTGFTACNVTKHLDKEKGGPLLTKNSIELKTEKPLPFDQKTPLLYELSTLYRQKPNERGILAFGTPARLWFYFKYRDKESRFAKWVMNKIAEPPAYFDEELAIRTSSNLQNYMRQRGYFQAKSTYTVQYYSKGLFHRRDSTSRPYKAAVTYTLDIGPQYFMDTVQFASQDSNVLQILQRTKGASHLKTGGAIDSKSFEAEKLRITSEMKNRGYAYFVPNFIEFTGDSTGSRANVLVEVLPQDDSSLHKTYTIGNVTVFSDLIPDLSSIRRDTTIGGIYFVTSDPNFEVKPTRLFKAISIHPGNLYRQDDFDKTARNLNALGIFKFVTIRPLQDTLEPNRINVAISFSLNNRLSVGGDVDLNSSTNSGSVLSGRLLGVSASLSAVNRNLLHGAENIRSDLAYSMEFNLDKERNSLIFSQEFKFQNELIFPRYFDYFGMWRGLNKLHLIKSSFYERLKSEGRVRVGLNYNFLDLRGFYTYNLFNAAFGYNVRSDAEHTYSFDNIGIDVLRPNLTDRFKDIFSQNEFLTLSFGNQLFTGFFLRSFTYTYSSRSNAFGERWFYRLNTEVSGLEELLLNRLWAVPFGKQTWTISDLEFSKYARLDMDGSYTREFNQNLTAIVRLGAGIVRPYGDTKSVPFVKQFFVGGPSSIRAWRIRELGPGGYVERDSLGMPAQRIQPFFQAADFRFEFNGELRFPLFWWLKGAIFIDGGNIWTLKKDPQRPDTQLNWDSYKEIAIGTGFGLRFDFDYFVFRFDWGLKLRQPYRVNDSYWVDWSGASWKDISNFNLAVGYPF
ncbi:MAG: hypothetical protein EP344_06310 [Bacteroidetes bacterium]|nr:MAG: hypothetical protein EP344_06310 [Bacteroidota bacterium]